MNIYIDESGVFANPSKKDSVLSFVGALLIPESSHDIIMEGFDRLKQSWGGDPEYKGSKLDEKQIHSVLGLLLGKQVVFKAVAIDAAKAEDEIEQFRVEQAKKFADSIQPKMPEWLQKQMQEAHDGIMNLSLPLFREAFMLWKLIADLLPPSLLYYILRQPASISTLRWYVDAKDTTKNAYEDLWTKAIMPIIKTIGRSKDYIPLVEGCDYSGCDWIEPEERNEKGESPIDLLRLLGQVTIENSVSVPGIQLVDIAVSAVSRALRGRLGERGWIRAGKLMLKGRERHSTLPIYHLSVVRSGDPTTIGWNVDYAYVLNRLERDAKNVFTTAFVKRHQRKK